MAFAIYCPIVEVHTSKCAFYAAFHSIAGRVVLRRPSAGVRGHARGRVRLRERRLGAEHQHPADAAARRQDGPPQPQHAPRDAARYVPEQHPQRSANESSSAEGFLYLYCAT